MATHGIPPSPCATTIQDRLTVVILTHNRREELRRSLDGMRVLPEQPRLVVVDNDSSDGTSAWLETHHPDIDVVRTERNLGAAARNLGVQRVHTPYVAFSDDDTWWEAGSLRAAAEILDTHPDIAVLNAHIVVGPTARPDPACVAMSASPLEHIPDIGPMLSGFMAGACVMRTHVFLEANGYWPDFFLGGEEALLAIDILDAGHHIVYAPALTVHHWPSEVRDSAMRRHLLARNAIWTAWLRLPWLLALHRTRTTLAQVSDPRQRWKAAAAALHGARTVFSKRRLVRPDTRKLLERVWRHEAR